MRGWRLGSKDELNESVKKGQCKIKMAEEGVSTAEWSAGSWRGVGKGGGGDNHHIACC